MAKEKVIEKVIPHTELEQESRRGWQIVETFTIDEIILSYRGACTKCGGTVTFGEPTVSSQCTKPGCYGYAHVYPEVQGTARRVHFRVSLDPEELLGKLNHEIGELRADVREAKEAAERKTEVADAAVANREELLSRAASHQERSDMAERDVVHLRLQGMLQETLLAKLREAIGELQFKAIAEGLDA